MVDHDKQQILQKLEDDALAEARRTAQEKGQQELQEASASTDDTAQEQAGVSTDEGLDEDGVTY